MGKKSKKYMELNSLGALAEEKRRQRRQNTIMIEQEKQKNPAKCLYLTTAIKQALLPNLFVQILLDN
jgi:Na+/H+-translocating membrane pyrophosphatase